MIPVDVGIINKILKSVPAHKGSLPYIQWLSDLRRGLVELHSDDMRRVVNSCRLHLLVRPTYFVCQYYGVPTTLCWMSISVLAKAQNKYWFRYQLWLKQLFTSELADLWLHPVERSAEIFAISILFQLFTHLNLIWMNSCICFPFLNWNFSSPEHKCWRWAIHFANIVSVIWASGVVNNYHVHPLEATALLHLSWNCTRMFVLMKSRSGSDMGHIRLETRSLGQISLKPCSLCRGHSCASICMKLYQSACLDKSLVKLEYGSWQIKN